MNKNIKYSQNFLTSEKVLNQIIKQLNLKETDTVYEIGTGKGHLTTKLAKISKQVTSIELDSHLFNLSSEKLKLNTRVTLIHQDILQFQFPNKQRYKIVGSIPYHLSTQIIKKVVFESHASDIYLIVEEGFYKRTLDIHRTLGLLLHTQVSIQQLLKLPAECFHPKPKVNSVLIKLTRHTTDVPDKYWKLYTYFVSKWVNREYRQLFTKNQFHQAMKRNRQISRRIKKHLWLSNRSWARDVHSFGILHSWGALAGKSCSAQASSIWLIAGAFRRTQSK